MVGLLQPFFSATYALTMDKHRIIKIKLLNPVKILHHIVANYIGLDFSVALRVMDQNSSCRWKAESTEAVFE